MLTISVADFIRRRLRRCRTPSCTYCSGRVVCVIRSPTIYIFTINVLRLRYGTLAGIFKLNIIILLFPVALASRDRGHALFSIEFFGQTRATESRIVAQLLHSLDRELDTGPDFQG